MRKLFLLLLLLPVMVMGQPQLGNLPPLHVDGNVLKDIHGNKVVLHGVMDTPSMWFNSNRWSGGYNSTGATNCLTYFKKLFNFLTKNEDGAYCNVFRLHMDPAWTNQSGSDFRTGFTVKDGKHIDPHGNEVSGEADIYNFSKKSYETYLKSVYVRIALEALKKGMYVVVRPCGVCPGYLEVDDYYNHFLEYVWHTFAKNDSIRKYSGQISIELANEPVTLKAKGGASSAKAKHDFFQPVVDTIRAAGFDGIIWVPGTGWQASYEDYSSYPIEGVNIGYAVHNYAGWYGNSDENYDKASNKTTWKNTCINQFKKQVPVVETNPIIITEVDWSPAKPSAAGTGHQNEHGDWVDGNFGTWATGSTSKWGVGYKAILDHFGNISMTLSSSDCYIDWTKSNSTGHSYPAFKDAMEKSGLDPYDGSGVACFDWYAQYAKVDYPHAANKRYWTADLGNGKFVNPIMNGDFPDPDVIRVGDTYYMVSTTMFIFPGATIMKSKDLVNWEYCANPLLQIADNDAYNLKNGYDHYSQGQWATSLTYHDGKFYLYFISYGRTGLNDGKNVLLTTTDPEGTWDMKYMNDHYYDSGWLWDDGAKGDGYLYVACGIGDIYVNKLDAKTLKKISSQKVVSARDGLEGSRMYHIDDFYYIYVTTGGYWRGQTIYRSTNPMGPYEEMPNLNGFSDDRAGNAFSGSGIHQGGMVQTQTGEWWTILFKDAGSIGRVPYLEPVTWKDGWPIIGNKGVDVSKGGKAYAKPNVGANHSRTYLPTDDTFTDLTLGKQWGWNHNPDNSAWSLLVHPGWLRLNTACVAPTLDRARNSLTQRIMGYNAEGVSSAKVTPSYGTIKMDVSHMQEGDVAGLAVFQDPYSYIGVKVVAGVKKLVYYQSEYDEVQPIEKEGPEVTEDIIFLRAKCNFYTNACQYYYSYDNSKWTQFGEGMTMRYTLKIFVGQRFYLFNYATKDTGGYVDIDWFSTEPEYSEEMYYGEGVLKTLTVDDATAVKLDLSVSSVSLMPGAQKAFTVNCTMKSGLKSNVTTGCTYKVEDSSVAYITGGKIVGKGMGTTKVSVIYTDPTGNSIESSFDVSVSYFPIDASCINPSLIGKGTITVASNGTYCKLSLQKNGFGGWHYDAGFDMTGKGRYLVVNYKSASLAKPRLRIYDEDDVNSTHYYESDLMSTVEQEDGTKKYVLVVDLEEVAKTVDLSHVYYVGFTATGTSSIQVVEVYFSEDGMNPTDIETVEAFTSTELVSQEFFTLDGRKHNGLQRGTNIVRRTYSDGRVESIKILK